MNSFKIREFNDKNLFADIQKELFNEEFTLKNLDTANLTARHLQYWLENGLLPDKERKTDENHKFSFVDLIWIKIIYELRLLNFPIRKIKIVKDALLKKKSLPEFFGLKSNEEIANFYCKLWQINSDDREKFIKLFSSKENLNSIKATCFSVLFFNIFIFIKARENSKMLIFNTGETFPFVYESHESIELTELLEKETYISIPMFKLISNFIDDERNNNFISKAQILNDNELKILFLLRHGKYDSMTIHFKNGIPFVIEPTKRMKLSKDNKLSEILLKRGYEKIEVVTQDGNITYSPKTTKIFL